MVAPWRRYGGVVERTAVAEGADWFVSSHDELREVLSKHNVAFVGSGAGRRVHDLGRGLWASTSCGELGHLTPSRASKHGNSCTGSGVLSAS